MVSCPPSHAEFLGDDDASSSANGGQGAGDPSESTADDQHVGAQLPNLCHDRGPFLRDAAPSGPNRRALDWSIPVRFHATQLQYGMSIRCVDNA